MRLKLALLICLIVTSLGLLACDGGEGEPDAGADAGTDGGDLHPAQGRLSVGTNLGAMSYWTAELPFVNLMKTSSTWFSTSEGQWDDGRPLNLDERGWVTSLLPGQGARCLISLDSPAGTLAPGLYTIRYTGSGEVEYESSAVFRDDLSGPGKDVFEVEQAGNVENLWMVITETDPQDPLRDFVVTPPGGACADDRASNCTADADCETGECLAFVDHHEQLVFTPRFLRNMRAYDTIRPMTWIVQLPGDTTWAGRPKLTDARWSGWGRDDDILGIKGPPWEVLIEMSRLTDSNLWITVPLSVDDAYFRELAVLFRDTFPAHLRVYLELSNEVWNSWFPVADYAMEQGAAMNLSWSNGEPTNDYDQGLLWHALRTSRMGEIFAEVYGPSIEGRVVRTLGTFNWFFETTAWRLEEYNLKNNIDAVAIGPYFGLDFSDGEYTSRSDRIQSPKILSEMSVQEVLWEIEDIGLPEIWSLIDQFAGLADLYGLELLAYEAGHHLAIFDSDDGPSNPEQCMQTFFQAVEHPDMKDLYRQHLDHWKNAGGGLFVHFLHVGHWAPWECFGIFKVMPDDLSQTSSSRFEALSEFSQENPIWW